VVGQTDDNQNAAIPPNVSKWIFLGAILVSFLLLFWDIRKSRAIIASRDISWAFTSVIASRYYSIKDYKYYCLFWKINSSRKFVDSVAFFVFFTLKGKKHGFIVGNGSYMNYLHIHTNRLETSFTG
jgi:hypothetical protein